MSPAPSRPDDGSSRGANAGSREPAGAAPSSSGSEPAWPADALEVGRIVDAWGVKGWVKVQAFSSDPQALFS
ncbi:MAG: hypothetical protein M3Y67_07770 [Pseudomonadota bacterium]|nr:hypothetical protein [Pseudomonadota bacterium]